MQAKIIDFFDHVPSFRRYEILDRLKQKKPKKQTKKQVKA